VLKDAFQFYAKHNGAVLPWVFISSLGVTIVSVIFQQESFIYSEEDWWITLFSDMFYGIETPSPLFILSNGLATAMILYRVMSLISADFTKSKPQWNAKSFIQLSVLSLILYSAIYAGLLGIFAVVCVFGLVIFTGFVQLRERTDLFSAFGRGWELFIRQNNQGMSLQLIVLLVSFSFLLVLSAPILYMHVSVVQWNFLQTEEWAKNVIHFIEAFAKVFSLYLIFPLIASCISYLYFSQSEVHSAAALRDSIARMGTRNHKMNKR
jgi:hypothetical protein